MDLSTNAYIFTYTKKILNLLHPNPDDIDILDIAVGLSNQPRFVGQTDPKYSVAQHSFLLYKSSPEDLKRACLLHDASEAYLADLPHPLKKHDKFYCKVENNLQRLIFAKYGIHLSPTGRTFLKELDMALALQEAEYLGFDTNHPIWGDYNSKPKISVIGPINIWRSLKAKNNFIKAANELEIYE